MCPLHGSRGRGEMTVVQFAVISPGCRHMQEAQVESVAVALRDPITHNRRSPTVCDNLRLCNTDTSPSAFYSHLRAFSNAIPHT